MTTVEAKKFDRPPAILRCAQSGMCAGVEQARKRLLALHQQYSKEGKRVVMVHDIGHYTPMIRQLESLGIGLTESIDDIQDSTAVLVLSPHGHAPAVEQQILNQGRVAYDTTCPLVEKVEHAFDRLVVNGDHTGIHYGKRDHVETRALVARAPDRVVIVENLQEAMTAEVPDPTRVLFTSQTTLLVSEAERIAGALRARGLQIKELSKGSICYATEDRQNALKTAIAQAIYNKHKTGKR